MSVSKLDAKRFWHKHLLGHEIQIHGTCTWLVNLNDGAPVGGPQQERMERVCECGATWPVPQDDTWRLMAFYSCLALLTIAVCCYILLMDG